MCFKKNIVFTWNSDILKSQHSTKFLRVIIVYLVFPLHLSATLHSPNPRQRLCKHLGRVCLWEFIIMKALSEFSHKVTGASLEIWIIQRWYNIFRENFLHCTINKSPLWGNTKNCQKCMSLEQWELLFLLRRKERPKWRERCITLFWKTQNKNSQDLTELKINIESQGIVEQLEQFQNKLENFYYLT